MNWAKSNTLSELSVCPSCRKELEQILVETTLSGRKRVECTCGCIMYESSGKMWFHASYTISQNKQHQSNNYYDSN